ncbi:MAG: alpha/beta fold hydrolase [Promethearchaeota archaeon]|jgi:pimeloyl-ACP methyl ester carboxylesterase
MSEEIIRKNYPHFKSEYAEINDVKLHYIKAGPDDGELILFLHGFPQFWYMWRDQLLEFSNKYLAVALDMRGYNLSSKPEEIEQYQIHHLVEDIRVLVEEHFKRQKIILVGHDWGGVVAFPFANRHPNLIKKFVIINAPHPNIFAKLLAKNKDQQKSSQYVLLFRSKKAERVLMENNCQNLLNIVTTPDMEFTEDDRQMYINAWSEPGALTGGLNYYRAAGLKPPSLGEDMKNITEKPSELKPVMIEVPTLVIWGEKDEALTTYNLDGLGEYIPDLRIERIPDGSHWIINEQPSKINQLIKDFL